MALTVPPGFRQTMQELNGAAGLEWVANLPTLIATIERRWSLQVLPHFPELSYNFVTPAVRSSGERVVLKLGYPKTPELLTEINALRCYNGHGIVRLLDVDPELGVLLLERLEPGLPLYTLENDAQETEIAAQIMKQLWRPPLLGQAFPTVQQWASGLQKMRQRYGGGSGPFDEKIVAAAESIYAELLASMAEPVLLHGDLHHYNILSAQRQPWLALDPKGVVGEPAYEIGQFLLNPTEEVTTGSQMEVILQRRIGIFSEILALDRERLLACGFAHSVLSAWWSLEDHGYGWESALEFARRAYTLLR